MRDVDAETIDRGEPAAAEQQTFLLRAAQTFYGRFLERRPLHTLIGYELFPFLPLSRYTKATLTSLRDQSRHRGMKTRGESL
jgi:hypothetical protein